MNVSRVGEVRAGRSINPRPESAFTDENVLRVAAVVTPLAVDWRMNRRRRILPSRQVGPVASNRPSEMATNVGAVPRPEQAAPPLPAARDPLGDGAAI